MMIFRGTEPHLGVCICYAFAKDRPARLLDLLGEPKRRPQFPSEPGGRLEPPGVGFAGLRSADYGLHDVLAGQRLPLVQVGAEPCSSQAYGHEAMGR